MRDEHRTPASALAAFGPEIDDAAPPTFVEGERHTGPGPEEFPSDPDFPELAVATNPEAMLHLFRKHLRPVAGRQLHIEACMPFRFRCRQATSRYVLQYTLRVADPESGRRWNHWVTGLLYSDRAKADQRWRELRFERPWHEAPEDWRTFEPIGLIPELRMLVEVFPYDRRLPHLSAVMAGGASQQLEPLLLARLGPGVWAVEERTIEPSRYRTELGAALEHRIRVQDSQSGRRETLRCFLKLYRKDHGAEAYRLLQSLREWMENGPRPYSVIKPLTYLPELGTLALEEAPGLSLSQLLISGVDPDDALRRVARAVAAFNQDNLPFTRIESREDQLKDVRSSSTLVQWACPPVKGMAQAITVAVESGLQDVPAGPIHGDLKPDHIFLSDDDVVFIDLDSAVLGDPVRDPAHLFAYLTGKVGLGSAPRGAAREATTAFVDEYFHHVPGSWRDRFPLHCAGALLEVACGIFRHHEPGWRMQVREVVEAGEHILSHGFE